MKKTVIILGLLILSINLYSQKNQKNTTLKTQKDTLSYVLGNDIGGNLLQNNIDISVDLLLQGLKDAYTKQPAIFTDEQKHAILTAWQQDMMSKQQAEQQKTSEKAKDEGKKFLQNNKKQAGVIETTSGLQYKVVKEGTGNHPSLESEVTVHYHGTLIDGTVFDSSVQRGEPISFPLSNVIKGWQEGVQLMKPGAKYIFYIPSDLAYGDRAAGSIPPGSTLIFEVELISFK